MRNNPLVTLFLLCSTLVLLPSISQADTNKTNIKATTSQRVHPLLIGNDLNAVIEVTLDVPQENVHAKSFTFSLDGCDSLNDIDCLQLFYSGSHRAEKLDLLHNGGGFKGNKQALRVQLAGRPFGQLTSPAAEVTFKANQPLRPGRNVFWLSCKLRSNAGLTHKIDAQCTSVKTSAGNCTPDDTTPGIRHRIGYALRKHYDDGVHTGRIPALTITPRGTLLCVYDMRRNKRRDLQEDIDIGLNRSTDGGQTWEPVRVIMDMGEYGGLGQSQNGCSDPGIVVDQNTGEIFCAAVWMYGKPGKHQWVGDGSEAGFEIGKSAQFLMVRSTDDGLTWTDPENMTRKLKKEDWILLAPSPQAGITLRNGTLVLPGEGRDENDRQFSTLITSTDHGQTWTVGSPTTGGLKEATGNGECQAVELDDGSILLNARTSRPTKFRSVYLTRDLGQTWTTHPTHRKALIEPNCNGSTIRFDYQKDGPSSKRQPKHVLLFANPHSQTARNQHSIQVSFDDGMTWPAEHRLLLDVGSGNGYPSLCQIDEQHVGIVYEGSQAHLVFEKIAITELLKR